MKLFFVITIDVEPDCSPTWHYSNPLTFNGVKIGIKEILQPLFNKYGIVPTYLINNVVLEDEESVNVFRNLEGNFELGTHLHPEFIEPQKTVFNYAGSKGEANCCFYEPEIEFEKIKNITLLFEKKFGYKPTSFRAGRFSAGKNTIKSLIELGYKVDTSVTPNILWNDKTRSSKVDFRKSRNLPYFANNISFPLELSENKIDGSKILEVPITIYKEFNLAFFIRNLRYQKRIQLFKPIWLRPYYSSFEDMLKITHKNMDIVTNYNILNMMFHNVEILPNLSPYSLSEKDCRNYKDSLTRYFEYIMKSNIMSTKISNLYDLYK